MERKETIFTNKKALAVLSIGTITILAGMAVSPALAGIKSAYPQLDDAVIQLVLTLPSLFVIPACFGYQWIADRIGNKNTLILGIILYLFGGVGGGMMPGFYSMLAARAILGISCGILTPMAQTLISSRFTGELKERMTGYPAAASYLMGIFASFTVGNIAAIHWRLAFLVYLLAFAVLFLNVRYLPKDRPEKTGNKGLKKKEGISWRAVYIIISMALVNIAFYTFSTSIALFMKKEGIGADNASGIVVAVFMTAGFAVGIWNAPIRKKLGRFSVGIAALAMGTGYMVLVQSEQQFLLFLAAVLIGGSYSIFYTEIFLAAGRQSVHTEENVKIITYTTAAMFVGQALSGKALQCMEVLFQMEGYRFRFGFLSIALMAVSYVLIVWNCKKKEEEG